MHSNFNLYFAAALCVFLITLSAVAQPIQDSTDLAKMKASNFKAMDPAIPVTVLNKGNLKKTFKGLKVTVDNIGFYSVFNQDLRYTVVENNGKLAISKYTPMRTCARPPLNKYAQRLCTEDNAKYGRRHAITCYFPPNVPSCRDSKGSFYELTLDGLRMAERILTCWWQPIMSSNTHTCNYKLNPSHVYLWEAPSARR